MAGTSGKRVVVKVGTSTITHDNGSFDLRNMDALVRVLADLRGMGHEVVLVSSGAIGAGTARLGLHERPRELRVKQAAAAVGQCHMMHLYDKMFSEYNQVVAQILLTRDDVDDPPRAAHLKSSFETLLGMGVVPIVNENDPASPAEIEDGRHKVFGDNDKLSAIVARLVGADALVLLSDIDGLYDANPRTHPHARLVPRVDAVDEHVRAMAQGAGTWRGTGGMETKLDAAQIATDAGCDMVIVNGKRPQALYQVMKGESVGTRFVARRGAADVR